MIADRDGASRDTASGGEFIAPVRFEPPAVAGARTRRARVGWRVFLAIGGIVAGTGFLAFVVLAKSVAFEISPQPAAVAVSGGPLWRMGDRYLMLPGTYRVSLNHPGYRSLSEDIQIGTEPQQSFTFVLEKEPGQLTVASVPVSGAQVFFDDQPRGVTPVTLSDIPAGTHTLRVTADRYRPFSDAIDVEGLGRTQERVVQLEPDFAAIAIRSAPPGAMVTVDGEPAGVTPLRTEVLAGTRRFAVSLAGYKPWQQEIPIIAGRDRVLEPITLAPADARLALDSTPAGAAVRVAGTYRGVTPLEIHVAPDQTHVVELYKDGHASARREVRLESGQHRTLSVTLAAERGSVSFRITPEDAQLFIDDRQIDDVGKPVTLTARDHRVRVTKAGYADFTTTLRTRPGVEQRVNVVLKTLAQAKWESVKPQITSPGGQVLLLFRPDAEFTMGASRREQGRRSNEVMRRVRLDRAFYMSVREVSNAEFRRFASKHNSGNYKGESLDGDAYPAVNVTWEQAARYCNWLSEQARLKPVYRISGDRISGFDARADGFRLPTEAEWAWAARVDGGGMRKYPWGAGFPPSEVTGNYADRSAAALTAPVLGGYLDRFAASAPVGSFAAGEKGLYDLGGNVAEWVHDYYRISPPSQESVLNPLGPKTGEHHVIRGSSWMTGGISELRLSYRDYGAAGRPDVGFRVARWVE